MDEQQHVAPTLQSHHDPGHDHPQSGFFDGNPRTMFVFGLVTGVALSFVLSSILGTGAIRVTNNNTGNNTDTGANAGTNTGTNTGPYLKAVSNLPKVTSADHVRGDLKKAKIVMIEYSDFQCPYCERHHPTMQQVFDTYGDDVAWVYRHFPLTSIHPQAYPAALASECANEQGKFWEYADALFQNQDSLAADYYGELAGELGLNVSKFQSCLDDEKYADIVNDQQDGGQAAGVSGTPATFINDQLIMVTIQGQAQSAGAASFASIKALIDAELK